MKRWFRNAVTLFAIVHCALSFWAQYTDIVAAIECACLLVYAIDIGMAEYIRAPEAPRSRWKTAQALCWLICAVDVVASWATGVGGWSAPVRPVFVVATRRHMRFFFSAVLSSAHKLLPVVSIIVLILVIATYAAVLVLSGGASAGYGSVAAHVHWNASADPPYCSTYTTTCTDYFHDPVTAGYTLWNLLEKKNWPEVSMPAYSSRPATGLFFAGFLLVAHFFAYRLLLAVAFSSFSEYSRQSFEKRQRHAQVSAAAAFRHLRHPIVPGVSLATWLEMTAVIAPWLPEPAARIVFVAVGGGEGWINQDQFYGACRLLNVRATQRKSKHSSGTTQARHATSVPVLHGKYDSLKTEPTSLPPPPALKSARYSSSQRARRWLVHTFHKSWVATCMDLLVVALSCVDMAITAASVASDSASGSVSTLSLGVSYSILAFYVLEAILKMFALGPRGYWADSWHRVDLVVIISSCITLLLRTGIRSVPITQFKAILLLRLVRILRVLRGLKYFSFVLIAVKDISPLLWRVVAALLLTLYSWASLGHWVFNGVLVRSNPAVAASSYGVHNFYPLHFNDFSSSMYTVFSLLMVAKSPVILEGTMAGVDNWWPIVYHIAFSAIVVWLIVSVVIALILQGYAVRLAEIKQAAAGRQELWQTLTITAGQDLSRADPAAYPPGQPWKFRARKKFLALHEKLFGAGLQLAVVVDNETGYARVPTMITRAAADRLASGQPVAVSAITAAGGLPAPPAVLQAASPIEEERSYSESSSPALTSSMSTAVPGLPRSLPPSTPPMSPLRGPSPATPAGLPSMQPRTLRATEFVEACQHGADELPRARSAQAPSAQYSAMESIQAADAIESMAAHAAVLIATLGAAAMEPGPHAEAAQEALTRAANVLNRVAASASASARSTGMASLPLDVIGVDEPVSSPLPSADAAHIMGSKSTAHTRVLSLDAPMARRRPRRRSRGARATLALYHARARLGQRDESPSRAGSDDSNRSDALPGRSSLSVSMGSQQAGTSSKHPLLQSLLEYQ